MYSQFIFAICIGRDPAPRAAQWRAAQERQQQTAANLLFAFASIRLHAIMRDAAAGGYWEQCRPDTRLRRALRMEDDSRFAVRVCRHPLHLITRAAQAAG